MGSLEHGNETVDVVDRALRHLQVIIRRTLQRMQSSPFYRDVRGDDARNGSIRTAPGVFLAFRHDTSQPGPLNRERLGRLVPGADTVGLRVLPEDPRQTRPDLRGSDPVQHGERAQQPSSAT